jgi:hypothetical protein
LRNFLAGSVIALAGAATLAGARVETIDARILAGEVVGISPESILLKTDKGKQALPLGEVLEIAFAEAADAMETLGQRAVATSLGDLLAVSDLAFDGKKLRVSSSLLGRAELPMDVVTVIYLPSRAQGPRDLADLLAEMKLPPASGDRMLVARKGSQPLAVDGVIEVIAPEKITFRWKDEARTIARDSVRMVCLAAVSAETRGQKGVLLGRDGSALSFTALTLQDKTLRVESAGVGKHAVPLDRVAGIRLASDRVSRLADLKPDAVKEHGYFDTTFHYRANRSVAGGPLRLGGRTYRTGLGLHSFCELTYRLDGRYFTFVATVGIDDGVRPGGDATLTFLGDGKPLAKELRLTGKDAPQPVRIRLTGVKTLLIRVDFGTDGLDFCDHVDLAGARLIK